MEIIYKCEVCGNSSTNKEAIEHCEASHVMTPVAFRDKLTKKLGKGVDISLSKFSGISTYALKITKHGIVVKDANMPVSMMNQEKIDEIVSYVRRVDRVCGPREIGNNYSYKDLELIDQLKVINVGKKFTVRIGVE